MRTLLILCLLTMIGCTAVHHPRPTLAERRAAERAALENEPRQIYMSDGRSGSVNHHGQANLNDGTWGSVR